MQDSGWVMDGMTCFKEGPAGDGLDLCPIVGEVQQRPLLRALRGSGGRRWGRNIVLRTVRTLARPARLGGTRTVSVACRPLSHGLLSAGRRVLVGGHANVVTARGPSCLRGEKLTRQEGQGRPCEITNPKIWLWTPHQNKPASRRFATITVAVANASRMSGEFGENPRIHESLYLNQRSLGDSHRPEKAHIARRPFRKSASWHESQHSQGDSSGA